MLSFITTTYLNKINKLNIQQQTYLPIYVKIVKIYRNKRRNTIKRDVSP